MKTHLASKPAIFTWESHENKQFRESFPDVIQKLPKYSFLDQKTFKVVGYYVGQNVGSVVAKVTDKSGTYVVKSTHDPRVLTVEVVFLQQWEKVGANVVEVLEFIKPRKDFPVTAAILKYVPGGTTDHVLAHKKDKLEAVYRKLGKGLAIMHRAKGHGYGEVVDVQKLKGKYATFRKESETNMTSQRKQTLLKHKLITKKDLALFQKAIEIVEADIARGTKPTLIHDDPGLHNTFGVAALKFFDPIPRISHPLKDVAIALIWAGFEDAGKKMRNAILEGYYKETPYDEATLWACIYLRVLGKWEWWLYRGKTDKKALGWIVGTKPLFVAARKYVESYSPKI